MNRGLLLIVISTLFTVPAVLAQDSNHIEVGVFAEYFNLAGPTPHINFVGIGGRAAFNVRSNVQIEAEMSYDFARNFTSTFNSGVGIQFVTVNLRPLHALFGPKISTSGGAARLYGTFKAGLINFSVTNQNGLSGFQNSLGDVTVGNTSAAIYPGLGVEGFWGPIGFARGSGRRDLLQQRNPQQSEITLGPTFRF